MVVLLQPKNKQQLIPYNNENNRNNQEWPQLQGRQRRKHQPDYRARAADGPQRHQGQGLRGPGRGRSGSELSFQTLVPGQDSGFLHTHKTHEELYIILRGEGTYQVDGEQFPVSEGTIVRVSPDGRRALKNTGSENLTMLCIQYRANNFTEADSPMTDGNILADPLVW